MGDSSAKDDLGPAAEIQELVLSQRIYTLVRKAEGLLQELEVPESNDPRIFAAWLDKTHELEDVWTQALFLKGYLHSLRAAQEALNEGDHRAAFAAVAPWLEDPERVGRTTHSKGGAAKKLSSWHEHQLQRLAAEYRRVKPRMSRSHGLKMLMRVCEERFEIIVSEATMGRAIPKSILPPQGS